MTRPSKRKQVEALGWTLAPIPRHVPAGLIKWPDGRLSAAFDDYKRPEGWVVTPPPGRDLPPRRFEGSSPNAAVRWAFDQAHAAPAPVGGVAGLLALAMAAAASGVVAEEGTEPDRTPALLDGELLALCGEAAGCDRIAEAARGSDVDPWTDKASFRTVQDRLSEAIATKRRLLPRIVELRATTPAGALAQARAVAGMFDTGSGQKVAAMRALLASLEAVLQPAAGAPR